MRNPGTDTAARNPRIPGPRRGLGRAACAGLVVLAGTFAVAVQAQQTRDYRRSERRRVRACTGARHTGESSGGRRCS